MFDFVKNVGPAELLILVLILIVLFGGKAVAKQLARSGGKAVKEAKEVKKEFDKAAEENENESSTK